MPKKCIKFVAGFLIPSLNEGTFGDRLKWINKGEGKFQMDWRHKGGPGWTKDEAEVFVEWDKHKGRFQPNETGYYTQSKQRFRSLLYKLTHDGHLIKEKSEAKNKKIYYIGERKQRRRKNSFKQDTDVETSNEGSAFDDWNVYLKEVLHYDNVHLEEIFPDNVTSALEDHTYSNITSNSQNNAADNRCEEVMDDTSFYIPVNEKSDFLEKPLLGKQNIVNDNIVNGMLYVNGNCSEIRTEGSFPDENIGRENLEVPISGGLDFTSVHQPRFSEVKSLTESPEFSPSYAFEWANLNVNNLLQLL